MRNVQYIKLKDYYDRGPSAPDIVGARVEMAYASGVLAATVDMSFYDGTKVDVSISAPDEPVLRMTLDHYRAAELAEFFGMIAKYTADKGGK